MRGKSRCRPTAPTALAGFIVSFLDIGAHGTDMTAENLTTSAIVWPTADCFCSRIKAVQYFPGDLFLIMGSR
ncbi:hypothetical protein B0H63DRAFT_470278 [Podospora didyma]|uniref:Secreted protein n=1 Tax=Podospora didyma TaxID=330526 RepID=A0AAE0NTV0_9PEZI|nr:hypothetical protein B0H63DRAFT_470278 [Podospora didyma]